MIGTPFLSAQIPKNYDKLRYVFVFKIFKYIFEMTLELVFVFSSQKLWQGVLQ